MNFDVAYSDAPPVDDLRRDWAGMAWNGRAERRWVTSKNWGNEDWRWARGVAHELLISKDAHDRLVNIWRTVRSVDDSAYGAIRAEAQDGKWSTDLPRIFVRGVVARLREAGIEENGPTWIAAERAAIRAASRVRDRQRGYGWTRPYGPRDIVATIRLPFGGWRQRPLRALGGDRYADDPLGEFEVRAAGRWTSKKDFIEVRPESCDYAECALLSGGWAIRFVGVRSSDGGSGLPPP